MVDTILFVSFSAVAVIAALIMISRVNPLISALWLILCLSASAGIFALLAAPVVAVLQILIYAGAVMVLVIFVIMLIDLGPKGLKSRVVKFGKTLGAIAALYLFGIVALTLWRPPFSAAPAVGESYQSAATLGRLMLTTYAVPFEIASLLLLAAIVGAVVMGKKRL